MTFRQKKDPENSSSGSQTKKPGRIDDPPGPKRSKSAQPPGRIGLKKEKKKPKKKPRIAFAI
jgi:hypothetical protein